MNDSINRRHFLKQAAVTGVGLGLAGSTGFFTSARAKDAGIAWACFELAECKAGSFG
jgi:hypothetical protein